MIAPRLPLADPFDAFVARLSRRMVGCPSAAVERLVDLWHAEEFDDGSFLDYLVRRGVLDRVAARAILLAWRGGLDERDAKQLVPRDAIERINRDMLSSPDRKVGDPLHPIGSKIGRYVIKGVLGRGGYGPVYLATHPTLRVPVAVKVLARAAGECGESHRAALRSEARLQAVLNHSNVVRVWDYEEADEPFLVLEYVAGENLLQRLNDGPLSIEETFAVAWQTTLGLRAAQRYGIVHGDVKPSNILTTPEGGYKLADFGLAHCRRKFVHVNRCDAPRRADFASGTPNYMAPEQFENCHDSRSDIYSLGLTLYHALSGSMPVVGRDFTEVMLRQKRDELPPLHRVTTATRGVSELVQRMTAKDPERRFSTYDDLLEAIRGSFGLTVDLY